MQLMNHIMFQRVIKENKKGVICKKILSKQINVSFLHWNSLIATLSLNTINTFRQMRNLKKIK